MVSCFLWEPPGSEGGQSWTVALTPSLVATQWWPQFGGYTVVAIQILASIYLYQCQQRRTEVREDLWFDMFW